MTTPVPSRTPRSTRPSTVSASTSENTPNPGIARRNTKTPVVNASGSRASGSRASGFRTPRNPRTLFASPTPGTPSGHNLRSTETRIHPTPSQLNTLENGQKIRLQDALDHEFNYYCVLARQLTGSLMEEALRNEFVTWIHLLVNPLIISSQEESVRVKRNRYLFLMVISMLNDEHASFLAHVSKEHKKYDFKRKPVKVAGMRGGGPRDVPEKIANDRGIPNSIMTALNPIKLFDASNPNAEWERQHTWDDYLETINKTKKVKTAKKSCKIPEKMEQTCIFHHMSKCETSPVSAKIGHALDLQFEFLIDLARSSAIPLPNSIPQTSLWMQALCEIDKTFCTEMKGIRNDYVCLLVGYMTNNQLDGPFEYPPTKPLCPLREAAMTYAKRRPAGLDPTQLPLNPVSDTVENFMNECPLIDEGAFAFLALSGSMFNV